MNIACLVYQYSIIMQLYVHMEPVAVGYYHYPSIIIIALERGWNGVGAIVCADGLEESASSHYTKQYIDILK